MQGMFDDFWNMLIGLAVLIAAAAAGVGFLLGRI